MLSRATLFVLFIILHGILAQPPAETPVYCVKNAPAIFWPSDSLPNVERVSFQDANVQLTIAPTHDDGSVVVRLQSIPYQSAVLRINLPGTFCSSSSSSNNNNNPSSSDLDCGSRAAGIISTDSDSLLTSFASSSEPVYDALPLQFDITIIVSRTEDGPNSFLVYAYERIYLEEWMLDASKEVGETDGVGVQVIRHDNPSVTLNFGAGEHNESTSILPTSPTPTRTPPSKTLVVPPPTASPTPLPDVEVILNPLKSTYGTDAQSSLSSIDPSSTPTDPPSSVVTSYPTAGPTASPTIDTSTNSPTSMPTSSPTIDISTSYPTSLPTSSPTIDISTSYPTSIPTSSPTTYPTSLPTTKPSTNSPTSPPVVPEPQWIDSVDITTAGSSAPAVVVVPNIMVEGTHVHLAKRGLTPLSLVVNAPSPQVHKVSFLYDGGMQRVEGTAPYVMGGNNGDRYNAVDYLSRPEVKVVTVRAHDASMNVLESVTYTFTVDVGES